MKKYKTNIIFMGISNVFFFLLPFPAILSNLVDPIYDLSLIDIWVHTGAIISLLFLFNVLGYFLGKLWKIQKED